MDSSRQFSPSPAFSDSDSLAGIDDLDAFLDAKGALSRWPTPPSRREIEEDLEVPSEESDYDSEDGVDDLDVATVFARELGLDGPQAWDDILMIEDVLVRARLPIEVLAIAFNILSKVVKQPTMDPTLNSLPLDLLVISTLSLAAIYTNDHPPSSSHWSRNVALGTATAKQIDAASVAIMEALDWQIHSCSEGVAIVAALQLFERRGAPTAASTPAQEVYEEPCLKPQPLSLNLTSRSSSGGEARWDNGQLTPTTPSPCSELEDFRAVFLPLL